MEIQVTKDYSLFKALKGNRPLNIKHVQKLVASMRKKRHNSPIQVNEKMEVVDGQHRLEALKELKQPVEYYISKGANLETVQDLNTHSENWKVDDYLSSHISKGIKDYVVYKQFMDSYKFNHKITAFLLSGDPKGDSDLFNSGNFKIKSVERAASIASKLTEVGQFYPGFKRRTFCYAFVRCLNNPKFLFEDFIRKLSYQRGKLYDCAKVDQYLELIEEIYNYKRSAKDKVVLRSL